LIVKKNQTVMWIVYNYRSLRHVMTKNWPHFWSWYTAFSFYGRILKTWQGKTMGTRGKINTVW